MMSVTLHATQAPRCNVHVIDGRTDAGAVSLMIRDGLQHIAVHVPRNAGDLQAFALELREASDKYRQAAAILRAAELAGLAVAEVPA
jgi:hypothetical protein